MSNTITKCLHKYGLSHTGVSEKNNNYFKMDFSCINTLF